MKNLLIISFLFIVEEVELFCQTGSSKELIGFRNAPWGTSVNEVKTLETARYMQSFEGFGIYSLSYRTKIAGLTVWADYTFIDGKLIEGSYLFEQAKDFKDDFNKLKNFLITDYSKPDFRAGPLIEFDSVWIKVTEYGKFRGPELYWQFNNGFVALIASKFEDEITITILYSCNKSIEEYNKDREVSVDSFSNFNK